MTLLLGMLLAARLGAASLEPWVGGTRAYETVPIEEVNASLLGSTGETDAGGARLDWGVLDHWDVWGSWQKSDLSADAQVGDLGSQIRLGEEGQWPANFGLLFDATGSWQNGSTNSQERTGLVVSRDLGGNCFDTNLLYDSLGGFQGRFAYRSPYLYWALRSGFEWVVGGQGAPVFIPQLMLDLPGDIAIQAGPSLETNGPVTWLFTASYEIFPTP